MRVLIIPEYPTSIVKYTLFFINTALYEKLNNFHNRFFQKETGDNTFNLFKNLWIKLCIFSFLLQATKL